jgi:hypothetical protein
LKITKTAPKKSWNCWDQFCEAKGQQEQWRRVLSTRHRHWRRVGPRATDRKSKQTGGLQQPPPLFLSLPAVNNVVTCKTPRNANSKVSGSVSLLQIYSLLPSPFDFLFFPSSGGGRL